MSGHGIYWSVVSFSLLSLSGFDISIILAFLVIKFLTSPNI